MPTYEYDCLKCGNRFEIRRGIKDSEKDVCCPRCGIKDTRCIFSTFGTAGRGSCAPGAPS